MGMFRPLRLGILTGVHILIIQYRTRNVGTMIVQNDKKKKNMLNSIRVCRHGFSLSR